MRPPCVLQAEKQARAERTSATGKSVGLSAIIPGSRDSASGGRDTIIARRVGWGDERRSERRTAPAET